MTTPGAPGPYTPRGPLRRSRRNRFVAGVAAGFAEGRSLDPTVVRVAFVLLALVGGFGLFLYLLAWAGMPGPLDEPSLVERLVTPAHRKQVLASGLGVAAVASALAGQLHLSRTYLFPSGLILLGVLLIVPAGTRSPRPQRTTSLPERTDETAPADRHLPAPLDGPDERDERDALRADSATRACGGPAALAPVAPRPFASGGAVPHPRRAKPRAGRTRPPRRWRGWRAWQPDAVTLAVHLSVGAVVLFGGLAGAPSATLAGVSLLLVGAGLVTRAWVGHPFALLRLGVVVVLLTPMLGRVQFNPSDGVGSRAVHPTAVAALHPYRLAVGSLHVDLQDLTVPDGDTAEVTAHVSVGEVVVTVPTAMRVQVEAAADAGAVRVFGLADRAGIDRLPVRHTDGGSEAAPPALVLHVSVDVGQVEVRRG